MTRSRVVIFDLDDTLWDLVRTMQRAHQEWAAAVSELPGGGQLAEAHPDWRSWTDASQVFAEIKKDRPDLGKDLTRIRREAMRLACISKALDPEVFVERGYQVWTEARNRPILFDATLELLTRLKTKGVVVGAISDGFADLSKMPEIDSLLDFAVFAKDVGASKPDPKLFQIAISKAEEVLEGTCTPAECVMVGDRMWGYEAVGMKAVFFDNPNSFPRAECGQLRPASPLACDLRIASLEELAPALDTWTAS